MADAKQTIGARAGRELKDGQIINLGIGLPTLIADYVIAEVENLYTLGELDPNAIHTSGIFVDAVVRSNVEYCTLREEAFNG